jgi:error-prone DNA polymerase
VKIAHVDSEPGWRGGQAQVLGLLRGLAARGHTVVLLCPAGPLAERAAAAGVRVLPFAARSDFDLGAARRLTRDLRAERPDLVHLHSGRAHAVGAPAARWAGRLPVVVSRRVDFAVATHPLSALKYRFGVDRYLCISEGVRRVLAAAGVPERRLRVVPSGIDVGRWRELPDPAALARELGLAPGTPVAGNIAALAPHKDQSTLLRAAGVLATRRPEVRWVVFGEGPLRAALESERARLGLAEVVALPGFTERIGEALALLDVFVLSSYLEGLGTSVLDAQAAGVPVVATQDALCAAAADGPLADALACIREHRTLDTAGRLLEPNRASHLRSPKEMTRLFADLPEAIAASRRIADACPFRLHQLPYRFPSARLEAGRDEAGELRARVEEGARERYFTVTPRVRLQLERELSLIAKLGLAGYFLVVHDIVRFCRSRGILAQGRGSAANSAVCYALSITAVDPIAMELLFERFLSEERGEWPDIDIDLPSGDLREEVIQHVYRTYGERGAAMTANVITYKRRSAIREVGKVLGFSPEHLDRLSALSGSWEFAAHVREELPEHLAIAGLAPEERRSKLLVELVARIMHLPRHLGQHSGGMVLAAGRLDDVVPLEPASMPGRVVIQWDKDDCADLGIIKVDLLGLGMLQVLQDVVPLIREHEGVAIDLAHLPPDDPEVYGMLCRADTVGVFQIESRAQMATLPRMQPQRFYDLVVEVAIIRPGPIVGRMVHPYLNRRAGRERVMYPHPDLEPILKRTLGVPLFQEQLMRVAMVAAGFSGGQAEELRRAMGAKRSVERMAKLERQLREGMTERGIVGKVADDIVQGITSFALYGFPESHAASFALIAYASAYLRAHHPVCFLAALLNAWPMGFYHPATLVQDAKRHGVRVLPIDVNHSGFLCRVERSVQAGAGAELALACLAVRLGLRFVKGLREEAVRRIEEEAARAPFTSVREVAARCSLRNDELAALAEIGAFASLGQTRRSALWQVSALDGRRPPLAQAMQPDPPPSPLPEMTLRERYVADYLGSGVTVGKHPLALRRTELAGRGILSAAQLARVRDGQLVRVAGVVIVRQRPYTAKGMCFMTLEDETGFANVAVMPKNFELQRAVITSSALLEVEGRAQARDGVVTVLAGRCHPLPVATPASPSRDFH